MYNGYLPTTHEGLIDTINEVAPFSIPAMVFSGENDDGFKDMAPALCQQLSFRNVWRFIAKLQDTIPHTKAIRHTIRF